MANSGSIRNKEESLRPPMIFLHHLHRRCLNRSRLSVTRAGQNRPAQRVEASGIGTTEKAAALVACKCVGGVKGKVVADVVTKPVQVYVDWGPCGCRTHEVTSGFATHPPT